MFSELFCDSSIFFGFHLDHAVWSRKNQRPIYSDKNNSKILINPIQTDKKPWVIFSQQYQIEIEGKIGKRELNKIHLQTNGYLK